MQSIFMETILGISTRKEIQVANHLHRYNSYAIKLHVMYAYWPFRLGKQPSIRSRNGSM